MCPMRCFELVLMPTALAIIAGGIDKARKAALGLSVGAAGNMTFQDEPDVTHLRAHHDPGLPALDDPAMHAIAGAEDRPIDNPIMDTPGAVDQRLRGGRLPPASGSG
jgi:hypothetical protein